MCSSELTCTDSTTVILQTYSFYQFLNAYAFFKMPLDMISGIGTAGTAGAGGSAGKKPLDIDVSIWFQILIFLNVIYSGSSINAIPGLVKKIPRPCLGGLVTSDFFY